jgi:hypothetical protein
MKTLQKILLLSIIPGILTFASCDNDDDTDMANTEVAKAEIDYTMRSVDTTISKMDTTKGTRAIETLYGISQANDPFESNLKSTRGELLKKVNQVVNSNQLFSTKVGGSHFKFDDHTGTYNWQKGNNWNKDINNPDDRIIIKFPTDTSNFSETGNNAVLNISKYQEKEVQEDTGSNWVTVKLKGFLKINDTKYIQVDHEISLDNFGDPSSVEIDLAVKPFTLNVNTSIPSDYTKISLFEEGKDLAILSADLRLETEVINEKNVIKKMNGYFQIKNLEFDGSIKPYALYDSTQYSGQDMGDIKDYMNNQMNLQLNNFITGKKLADIKFEIDETAQYTIKDNIIVNFEFKDGTTQNGGPYLHDIITKLEGLWSDNPVDTQ